MFKGHKSGGVQSPFVGQETFGRPCGLRMVIFQPLPEVVIITSQAGSVEWRFTQNKGEGLEAKTFSEHGDVFVKMEDHLYMGTTDVNV